MFEGSEKKLGVILSSPRPEFRNNDLGWKRVVQASGAEILNKISTPLIDAYLLSESSLFVWSDRILMITCGTTRLVNALDEMLSIMDQDDIAMLFYERKNYTYPSSQPSDFKEEVSCLERHFSGKSYRIGPANGDHIHLYYFAKNAYRCNKINPTLRILMQDFLPSARRLFDAGLLKNLINRDTVKEPHTLSGKMALDEHLFSPYGYSLNGILAQYYFTVHITPQFKDSYASFETTILTAGVKGIIEKVVSFFQPSKFSLVLTGDFDSANTLLSPIDIESMPTYSVVEKGCYKFDCRYQMTFIHCVSSDSPI